MSAASKSKTEGTILQRLTEQFGEAVVETHDVPGGLSAIVKPERIVEIIGWLRDEPGLEFDMLMDLCGVDYLPRRPRFEVVYNLYSVKLNHRLRIRVQLGADQPEVATITTLYKCADWFEREVWDMFGIKFIGHPDLRRILMYDQFEGHPLRRDYPYNKRQPIVAARTRHL